MRQLFVATVAVVGLCTGQVQAGKVEVSGVHLCCKQCVDNANKALSAVDGVTDVTSDQKTKTVTFKAKDTKAAEAGVKALIAAGFFGSASEDGKDLKIGLNLPKKGEKADEVTVKGVHVCCKRCQNMINDLFKDAKVTYSGTGVQKDVKISGKGLDKEAVLETLLKAGFSGKVE
jgi:copper chaperone CopZ